MVAVQVGANISVSRTAPSDGGSPITNYLFISYAGPDAPGEGVTVTGTTYLFTGVSPGQQYGFKVIANNAIGMGGESALSNWITVCPTCAAGASCNSNTGVCEGASDVCAACTPGNTCDVATATCVPTPAWGECNGQPNDTALDVQLSQLRVVR